MRVPVLKISAGVPLVVSGAFSIILVLLNRAIGADFASFWASGRAVLEGSNPYAVHALTSHADFAGRVYQAPNLNPPISLLAFAPIAALEPMTAFRLWQLASLGLLIGTVALLLRGHAVGMSPLRFLWLITLPGIWSTLDQGQVYAPLILLGIGAWVLVSRGRYLAAGICLGALVAIKPNFVIWPAFLLLGGYAPPALISLAVTGALSLLPVVVYGPGVYSQWMEASALYAPMALPGNVSLWGLFARLEIPALGAVAAALLLVALGLWVLKRRPGMERLNVLSASASLLASPVAWAPYLLVLLPLFTAPRPWTHTLLLAACLLSVPGWLLWDASQTSPLSLLTLGSLHTLAPLALILWATRGHLHQPLSRKAPQAE